MKQRTFKFRVWNGQEFDNPDYLECGNGGELMFFAKVENRENFAIQQFTGRQDSNKVDIYEGDIVNVNGENRAIIYRGSGFFAAGTDYQLDTIWFAGGGPKVVGNIFEHGGMIADRLNPLKNDNL